MWVRVNFVQLGLDGHLCLCSVVFVNENVFFRNFRDDSQNGRSEDCGR